MKARESFRSNLAPKIPNFQKGYIEIDFNICISLAHALEILNTHGLRTFYIFLVGVVGKKKGAPVVSSEIRNNQAVQSLMKEVQSKLNISIENSTFDFDMSTTASASILYSDVRSPNTSITDIVLRDSDSFTDYTLSHPKLKILKNIVEEHFLSYQCRNDATKAIIFSQYRDSVQEIGNMLNSLRPMVKPMIFIGKSNSGTGQGLKQKQQVQVVEQFRNGDFNVLVATSVGEEGLDIGEVDLIICFDASRSPTRLIQRMGRTGRKRDGKTIFLLTSGKEEKSYMTSISQHSSISKTILDATLLEPFLFKKSPRMVPVGVEMSCYKMEINLPSEQMKLANSKPLESTLDYEKKDSNDTPGKPKKTKKTLPGAAAKKKKPPPPASETTLATMFERIKKDERTVKAKTQEATVQEPMSGPANPRINEKPTYENPEINEEDDDIYVVDDDIHHMFAAVEPRDRFGTSSVIEKIFDMDSKERKEWVPCTSFFKKNMPSTSPIRFEENGMSVDDVLLDFDQLEEIENAVESRSSFSYLNREFCGCGNVMEKVEDVGNESDDTNMDSINHPEEKKTSQKMANNKQSTSYNHPELRNSNTNVTNKTPQSKPSTFIPFRKSDTKSSITTATPTSKESPVPPPVHPLDDSGSTTDFSEPALDWQPVQHTRAPTSSTYSPSPLNNKKPSQLTKPEGPLPVPSTSKFTPKIMSSPITSSHIAPKRRFTFKKSKSDESNSSVFEIPSSSSSSSSGLKLKLDKVQDICNKSHTSTPFKPKIFRSDTPSPVIPCGRRSLFSSVNKSPIVAELKGNEDDLDFTDEFPPSPEANKNSNPFAETLSKLKQTSCNFTVSNCEVDVSQKPKFRFKKPEPQPKDPPKIFSSEPWNQLLSQPALLINKPVFSQQNQNTTKTIPPPVSGTSTEEKGDFDDEWDNFDDVFVFDEIGDIQGNDDDDFKVPPPRNKPKVSEPPSPSNASTKSVPTDDDSPLVFKSKSSKPRRPPKYIDESDEEDTNPNFVARGYQKENQNGLALTKKNRLKDFVESQAVESQHGANDQHSDEAEELDDEMDAYDLDDSFVDDEESFGVTER